MKSFRFVDDDRRRVCLNDANVDDVILSSSLARLLPALLWSACPYQVPGRSATYSSPLHRCHADLAADVDIALLCRQ